MDCFRIFQILHISFNTPRTYIVIIFFFGFFDFILYVPPRSFHSLFSSINFSGLSSFLIRQVEEIYPFCLVEKKTETQRGPAINSKEHSKVEPAVLSSLILHHCFIFSLRLALPWLCQIKNSDQHRPLAAKVDGNGNEEVEKLASR